MDKDHNLRNCDNQGRMNKSVKWRISYENSAL
jgi:hypothetical protein